MADANRIQSAHTDKIQVKTERIVVPYGGFIDSGDIDQFAEAVTDDLVTLSSQTNSIASAVDNVAHVVTVDKIDAHQRALALEKELAFLRQMFGRNGWKVPMWYDFHDASRVSHVDGADVSKRATLAAEYGQLTIPMNSVESRTYALRLLAGGTVTPSTVIVTTSGVFDKLGGDGVVDYEYGGTIEETDPRNCVNGNNNEYWRRRVIFDLESDVNEVECEITIQVPASANLYANLIYSHPFPIGNVDVTGVWTSVDLSDSFTQIPSFSVLEGASKTRWFIPQQKIAKLKVRIRQKNWYEENGKKVFEYGFQELGIQLVDWDKTYDSGATNLTSNHTAVVRFNADSGFSFRKLYGLYSEPDFNLENFGERHVHFKLARDVDGNDVVWDSDTSAAPQNLAAPIDLGDVSTLYLFITLNWAEDVSVNSPYLAGTPPFLTGIGLNVTYVENA